jgi:hypothetical protein
LVGYPWGAHYLPVPFKENTEFISLLDEMNLTEGRNQNGEIIVKEQFLCREPEERVFYKGRWYEGLYLHVGASEEDLRNSPNFKNKLIFGSTGAIRKENALSYFAGRRIVRRRGSYALDKITFADWLRQKGFTSESFLVLRLRDARRLRLAARTNFGAWAGLFYFCSRVRQAAKNRKPLSLFPKATGVSSIFCTIRSKTKRGSKQSRSKSFRMKKALTSFISTRKQTKFAGFTRKKRFSPRRFLRRNI